MYAEALGLTGIVERFTRRWFLPLLAFALVLGLHFAWSGTHPECADPSGACATGCAPQSSWLAGYRESGSYWLGLSYAASAAYAVAAIRRALERRSKAARAGAARGFAISTLLPFVGCWFAGCCGSPMLGVYLNLLGARFLPFAKPLVAGLTAVMLTASWAWTRRREKSQAAASCCGPDAACCG